MRSCDKEMGMGTSIDPGVAALVGTVVGGLISFTATAWAERHRSQEARAFRNHAEQQRVAVEYLAAFNGYRRCIRDGDQGCVELARLHASAIDLLGLYFDKPVVELTEKAAACLQQMKDNPSVRQSGNKRAIEAREEVKSAMRKQLDEGGGESPRRWGSLALVGLANRRATVLLLVLNSGTLVPVRQIRAEAQPRTSCPT
jgi:hypothetical protein